MENVHYETIDCPYCGSNKQELFVAGQELDTFQYYHRIDGFDQLNYVSCGKCRLIYSSPRLKYTDTTLNQLFPEHVQQRKDRKRGREDQFLPLKRKRVEKLAELLPERGRYLEIGCGLGEAMELAAERGFQVRGTELYEGYIDHCRGRGLDVIQGEVDGICVENEEFDTVYMEDVLEHLKNPFSYLQDAVKALKSGGVLFVHTWTIENPGTVRAAFGPEWRAELDLDLTAHTTIFPLELLKTVFAACGLAVVASEVIMELEQGKREDRPGGHVQYQDFFCRKAMVSHSL